MTFEGAVLACVRALEQERIGSVRSEYHRLAVGRDEGDRLVMRSRHWQVDGLFCLCQADVLQHKTYLCRTVRHVLSQRTEEVDVVCAFCLGACHLRTDLLAGILHVCLEGRQIHTVGIRALHLEMDAVAIEGGGRCVDDA